MHETDTAKRSQRRLQPRRRVLKSASVVLNNRASTIDCLVRDISDAGARIAVEGLFRPPHEFDLKIPSARQDHACEVVWRHENQIGVRFVA